MGTNSTHTLAIHRVNGDAQSTSVHVPASEQREQGICIDDTVEVTIHDVNDYVDSASFEGSQVGGDSITVPADFVRSVNLELGETYPVSFEKVEEEADGEEFEELDGDVEEEAESVTSSGSSRTSESATQKTENLLDEMGVEVEAEEQEAEEEEKGFGDLFA